MERLVSIGLDVVSRLIVDGWLVAHNHGEFGAALYWFSSDGLKHYKISDHHIRQFLRQGSRVYAVEGLAHMIWASGSLIYVERRGGRWTAANYVKLPGAGRAFAALDGEDFIVVTSERLLRIHKRRIVLGVRPQPKWNILYPNSVAVQDGRLVYVGMRQFVARYDLEGGGRNVVYLLRDMSWLDSITNRAAMGRWCFTGRRGAGYNLSLLKQVAKTGRGSVRLSEERLGDEAKTATEDTAQDDKALARKVALIEKKLSKCCKFYFLGLTLRQYCWVESTGDTQLVIRESPN